MAYKKHTVASLIDELKQFEADTPIIYFDGNEMVYAGDEEDCTEGIYQEISISLDKTTLKHIETEDPATVVAISVNCDLAVRLESVEKELSDTIKEHNSNN